jgi:hypothetical protein
MNTSGSDTYPGVLERWSHNITGSKCMIMGVYTDEIEQTVNAIDERSSTKISMPLQDFLATYVKMNNGDL